MRSYSFLFWGYNVVWLAIAAYVGLLLLKLRRLDQKLERMERRLGADVQPRL